MSKLCPLYGIAIYLDCLECDNRKECKRNNMYEKYSNGRPSCCGNCMYHRPRETKMTTGIKTGIVNQIKGTEVVFHCSNPSSDYYGLVTEYYSNCIDFEDKADSMI